MGLLPPYLGEHLNPHSLCRALSLPQHLCTDQLCRDGCPVPRVRALSAWGRDRACWSSVWCCELNLLSQEVLKLAPGCLSDGRGPQGNSEQTPCLPGGCPWTLCVLPPPLLRFSPGTAASWQKFGSNEKELRVEVLSLGVAPPGTGLGFRALLPSSVVLPPLTAERRSRGGLRLFGGSQLEVKLSAFQVRQPGFELPLC